MHDQSGQVCLWVEHGASVDLTVALGVQVQSFWSTAGYRTRVKQHRQGGQTGECQASDAGRCVA